MTSWTYIIREQVARYTDAELATATEMLTRWITTEDAPATAAFLLRAVRDEARLRAAEDAALVEAV